MAVTTPTRSGPLCRLKQCVTSPYTDVAAFVPRDYLWMYLALALQATFLVLVSVITGAGLPTPVLAPLAFLALGAGMLVADCGLQLFVAQPSLLAGETAGLELLSQYNPHGLFIGLENVGYAAPAIGFIFLFLAVTLPGHGRVMGTARRVFAVGGILTWAAWIGFAAGDRAMLEYRFEVARFSLPWLVLVDISLLLAAAFRRDPAAIEEWEED